MRVVENHKSKLLTAWDLGYSSQQFDCHGGRKRIQVYRKRTRQEASLLLLIKSFVQGWVIHPV